MKVHIFKIFMFKHRTHRENVILETKKTCGLRDYTLWMCVLIKELLKLSLGIVSWCGSYLPCCWQIHEQSNLRKAGFVLAHTLGSRPLWWEVMALGACCSCSHWICCQEQTLMNGIIHFPFFFLFSPGLQDTECCHPHWGSIFSLKLI